MNKFTDIASPWVKNLVSYEPGRPIEEVAREFGLECLDVVKLASNENALGPSPLAVKAIKEHACKMHLYPDGGAYYFKEALSKKLKVKAGNIIAVNGSNEAIVLLAHVFLGPDSNIVMADRAFVVYRLIAASYRASVISVPMKNFTHDLDAMLSAVNEQTRIVFISNPNNPTSTMVDGKAIDRFMDRIPDNVIVCFDEAYVELLDADKQPDILKYVRDGRNVVILRTFSKTYGLAGLRIGYAVAPDECIALLNRVRQPFNVNAMAMYAAIAALGDENHVEKTRKMIKAGLEYVTGRLDEMELIYVPPVVNFVLVKVGNGHDVFTELQKKGIIVRPMNVYGLPDYIRITVGTADENRKTMSALKHVLESRGDQTNGES